MEATIEDRANGLTDYRQETFSKAEVQEAIRLAQMVGKTVTRTNPEGDRSIGTLESVYVTDGLAANVIGLVDWSKNGKDYGADFSMGPLYGATIELCPDPWLGLKDGLVVKVYANRSEADAALYGRLVDSVAPYFQPGAR